MCLWLRGGSSVSNVLKVRDVRVGVLPVVMWVQVCY